MGTNGAHHGSDHRDGTDKPYYNEQFAENYGHDESLFKWGDDREAQDQWENNRKHDHNESQYTDGRKYYGQYNYVGPDSDRRENGVPSRT